MQFNNRTYINLLAQKLEPMTDVKVVNMNLPAYYGRPLGDTVIRDGKVRVDMSGHDSHRSIDLVFYDDEIFVLNRFFEELSRGHVYGTTVREVYPIDRNFIHRNISDSTYDILDKDGRLDTIIAVLQAIAETLFQQMTDVASLFKFPNRDTEPIVVSLVKGSTLTAEPKLSWVFMAQRELGFDFGEISGDLHFRIRIMIDRIVQYASRPDMFQAHNTFTLQQHVAFVFADVIDIDVVHQSTLYPVGEQPITVSDILIVRNNLPRFMRDDLSRIYVDMNSVRRHDSYDYAQCAMTGLWSKTAEHNRYSYSSSNLVMQLPFLTKPISILYLRDVCSAVQEDECHECGSCFYATRATFEQTIQNRLDYPKFATLFNTDPNTVISELFSIARDMFTDDDPDHYCYACDRGEDYEDDYRDDDYRYRSMSDNQREKLTEIAKQYNKFAHNRGDGVVFKDTEDGIAVIPDMYEVHSYDYSPYLTFLEGNDMEKTKLYMGVELEMDGGGEYHPKANAINSALSSNQPYSWTMSDGSLSDGIEIATMPATLDAHMNVFNYDFACDVATALDYRAHDTASAGMHVHINRNFFGDDKHIQLYRASLMALIMERNWEDFVRFSRRRYSRIDQWAKKKNVASQEYTDRDVDLIVEKTKREYNNGDKYLALNMNRQKTFELRIFRGSLKANTIKATLQFVSNLAHYCKYNGLKSAQQATILDIINYKKYPELTAYWEENKNREVSE